MIARFKEIAKALITANPSQAEEDTARGCLSPEMSTSLRSAAFIFLLIPVCTPKIVLFGQN